MPVISTHSGSTKDRRINSARLLVGVVVRVACLLMLLAGFSPLYVLEENLIIKQAYGQEPPTEPTLPNSTKPNVLFIAVDDLRPQLNSYGHPTMHTPNMDTLASEGFLFTRAYVQQAVCSPSRTSLMTGLRPDTTAVYDLQTHFRDTISWVTTLPQHFMNHGYYTAGIGKIYHGGLNDADSWSEPHVNPRGFVTYALEENRTIAQIHGKGPPTESADVPDATYRDGQLTVDAIAKLADLKNRQPFFYAVGYVRPHLPFTAPTSYWDLYDPDTDLELPTTRDKAQDAPEYAYTEWPGLRSYFGMPATPDAVTPDQEKTLIHGYYASVSFVDKLVGDLLAALDGQGLADNTIIVIWGDHGWHLGEQGQWAKSTNFERATRNPLLMRVPQLAGNVITDRLIETVDLYPTLAELCGLPLPAWLQGQSFTALLENPELPGDADALSQFPRGSVMGYSLRTDRYRYTEWRNRNAGTVEDRELYDHELDPGEDVNVASQPEYTNTVNLLSNQLTERLNTYRTIKETGDSFLGQPGSTTNYLSMTAEIGNNSFYGSVGGVVAGGSDSTDNLEILLPDAVEFVSGYFVNNGAAGIELNFHSPDLPTVTVAAGTTWNFTGDYLSQWTTDGTPRIVVFDHQGLSNNFSKPYILSLEVAVPSLTVISPNGGEKLAAGTTHEITWTSKGGIANVKIEYSVNNGIDWIETDANTENDGSYIWEVPCDLSNESLVGISDVNGDAHDESAEVFIIEDQDSDNDGTPDCLDRCPANPNKIDPDICGCGVSDVDTDNDGTLDCNDNCPNDPIKTGPGICGCGIADSDSDGDGIPDCNDDCDNLIDSDDDGANDCDDLCPNDSNKTGPGICGCGIADTDGDGDGTVDCVDTDDDNDGLANTEEQGPGGDDPNYDGNNDRIVDSLQANVASFHTYDDQSYVTMASPDGTSIRNFRAVDNPSATDSPLSIEFPYGFFEFTITGVGIGGATTVTLNFPVGTTFDTYYKYGPTPGNDIDHWYEFLYDGQTGAEINGNIITLHFVDGKRGDDDLTATGSIIDIGGPAVSLNPGAGDGAGTSGGGGGGGCFITTVGQ